MKQSDLVLLGMLREGPRHGYEIDREIDARRYRDWARIGKSTVYSALERLARQGCVRVSVQTVGARPPRKVYRLTGAGRKRLRECLATALSSPRQAYSERLLGLMFAHGFLRDSERHQLFAALGSIEEEIAEVEGNELYNSGDRARDELGAILREYRHAVLVAERDALRRGTGLLVH